MAFEWSDYRHGCTWSRDCGIRIFKRFSDSKNILVYEKTDRLEGLCISFQINGLTFDSAVHLSFTESKTAREVLPANPIDSAGIGYIITVWGGFRKSGICPQAAIHLYDIRY